MNESQIQPTLKESAQRSPSDDSARVKFSQKLHVAQSGPKAARARLYRSFANIVSLHLLDPRRYLASEAPSVLY